MSMDKYSDAVFFSLSPTCLLAVRCQGHISKEAESKWGLRFPWLPIDYEQTEASRLSSPGPPVSQKGVETLVSGFQVLCWIPQPLERQVHDTLSVTDSPLGHPDLANQWGRRAGEKRHWWWQEKGEGTYRGTNLSPFPIVAEMSTLVDWFPQTWLCIRIIWECTKGRKV